MKRKIFLILTKQTKKQNDISRTNYAKFKRKMLGWRHSNIKHGAKFFLETKDLLQKNGGADSVKSLREPRTEWAAEADGGDGVGCREAGQRPAS